ncbi:insulin receptor substrate 1 isoform X1 [Hydra vulgaris]|uniref:insulin receptor substrate 1 isoform X1 n=2 Tax=Hydra vulgaris TaxID=6087 RepID=UPI001F5FE6AC|nr:insulin receptor substrate 1 isoform X1 [Hydra vulgaris]
MKSFTKMKENSKIARNVMRNMVQSTVAKLKFISNQKKIRKRQKGNLNMKSLLVALDEDSIEGKSFFAMEDKNKSHTLRQDNILMKGILKSLQNNKDQLFVLYKKGFASIARLESYENIKQPDYPSKVIFLSDCFDVIRTSIKRNPFTIILFTKNERLLVSAETERDCMLWLTAIEQEREACGSFVYNEPKYLKSWIVNVRCRGNFSLKGWYLLGVTLTQLDFVSQSVAGVVSSLDVKSIERSGYTENSFYMEIWMCNTLCLLWLDMEDPQSACSIDQLIKQLTGKGKKSFTDSPLLRKSYKDKAKNITQINLLSKASLYSTDEDEISSASSLCSSRSNSSDFQKLNKFKNSSSFCSSPELHPPDHKNRYPYCSSSSSNVSECNDISLRDGEANENCFSSLHNTSASSSLADDESDVFLDLEQAVSTNDLTSVYRNPTYVDFSSKSLQHLSINTDIEERQKKSKLKTLLRRRFSKNLEKASIDKEKLSISDLHSSIFAQLEFRPSPSVFKNIRTRSGINEDCTKTMTKSLNSDIEPVYESVRSPNDFAQSKFLSPNSEKVYGANDFATSRRTLYRNALPPIPPQRITSRFSFDGVDTTDFFNKKKEKDSKKDNPYEEVSYEKMINKSLSTIEIPPHITQGYEQMNAESSIGESKSYEEISGGPLTRNKINDTHRDVSTKSFSKAMVFKLTENDSLNFDDEEDSYAKISPSPRDFQSKENNGVLKTFMAIKKNDLSIGCQSPLECSRVISRGTPAHSTPTHNREMPVLNRNKISPSISGLKMNLSSYTNVSPSFPHSPSHDFDYSVPYKNEIKEEELTYLNNSYLSSNTTPEYESMLYPNKLDDNAYDNIGNQINKRCKTLAYADVLIDKPSLNYSDKDKELLKEDECCYMQIDFEKSQGVSEAIKDLRTKQSPTNHLSSSNKNDYLTDLSYKTFKKFNNT